MNQPGIEYFLPAPYPLGWALAAVLGVFWLTVLARPGWWRLVAIYPAVALGAALFAPSIAWVQVPLQTATGNLLATQFDQAALKTHLLLLGVPQILESGIVQEAAKLLALVVVTLLFRPRGGSVVRVGAAVGLAYGAFEAAWVFGLVFAAGWTTDTAKLVGWQAYWPFAERFFAVGFHAATGVILGVGLARGWAPAAYCLAAFLHAATNYGVVVAQAGLLDTTGLEIHVAVASLLTVLLALWLSRGPGLDRPDRAVIACCR